MKKNKTVDVDLKWKINNAGNWHRSYVNLPSVNTKPIAQVFIDGDEFVWKHDEILDLILAYYTADVEAIKMIKEGRAGNIKYMDTPLLEKIKMFIQDLEIQERVKEKQLGDLK